MSLRNPWESQTTREIIVTLYRNLTVQVQQKCSAHTLLNKLGLCGDVFRSGGIVSELDEHRDENKSNGAN